MTNFATPGHIARTRARWRTCSALANELEIGKAEAWRWLYTIKKNKISVRAILAGNEGAKEKALALITTGKRIARDWEQTTPAQLVAGSVRNAKAKIGKIDPGGPVVRGRVMVWAIGTVGGIGHALSAFEFALDAMLEEDVMEPTKKETETYGTLY